MDMKPVHIVGAGLAGSEAAWQIISMNIPVVLHEMRPDKLTPVHTGGKFAELVCSNSFRSDNPLNNAAGLLHEEMRRCGSLIMRIADETAVPAGSALAVDREAFAESVTKALVENPLIEVARGEITCLPSEDHGNVIIATGPLTADALAGDIKAVTGEDSLHFFDAIAPIVEKESIDFDLCWYQSRYDRESGAGGRQDYINCPFNKEEYLNFISELLNAEKIGFREWEKETPYFEGCMPVEVMASRGIDTLRFGPMKPVGLIDPRTGRQPYAVVQLRQDNVPGSLYNMVGFQTKMTYGAQKRVFRQIPGLKNAEFVRLGGMHRNTFINSPRLLTPELQLKAMPHLRFAGQITGCEGYVESSATGLLAGKFAASRRLSGKFYPPPATTALGALLSHITSGAENENFQPMNINFGLFPPVEEEEPAVRQVGKKKLKGREKKEIIARRALKDLEKWLASVHVQ